MKPIGKMKAIGNYEMKPIDYEMKPIVNDLFHFLEYVDLAP